MALLHLVNGFLGSGKTTAIVAAAKLHLAHGKRVGVVTNDQGRYLVDTAFVQAQNVPVVQVSGGCFCCNYADLAQVLTQLGQDAQPDMIYAESVGSCADLVATVLQPLRALREGGLQPKSLSAFADARLLLRRLRGQSLPFSDEVLYIWDQQIAEAGLLVVNKIDLLPRDDRQDIYALAQKRHVDKRILMQSSLEAASVAVWIETIESGQAEPPAMMLEMDYGLYSAGEAQLAWLDQALTLQAPHDTRHALAALLDTLGETLLQRGLPVGHIKLLAQANGQAAKLSLTAFGKDGPSQELPSLGREITLLINARVQGDAQELRELVNEALRAVGARYGLTWRWLAEQAFHPSAPLGRPQL